jgi:hypothetical protein
MSERNSGFLFAKGTCPRAARLTCCVASYRCPSCVACDTGLPSRAATCGGNLLIEAVTEWCRLTRGVADGIKGWGCGSSEQCLEFGKVKLDNVEVGTVRRGIEQPQPRVLTMLVVVPVCPLRVRLRLPQQRQATGSLAQPDWRPLSAVPRPHQGDPVYWNTSLLLKCSPSR